VCSFIIPLMLGNSGNGTWLVLVIATVGVACIARDIVSFARRTSSPGSLYTFVADSLPRASLPAAWAVLFAYLGTGIA
jgi:amino acid transporter